MKTHTFSVIVPSKKKRQTSQNDMGRRGRGSMECPEALWGGGRVEEEQDMH